MALQLLAMLREALDPDRLNRELREEMEFHVSARADQLELEGLSPREALRQARLEFGAAPAAAQQCREARGLLWLDEGRRNVVFAFRQMARQPAFAISAILTLGLCIGANTAVFSAVDALLLRPLSYPAPERLALLAVQTDDLRTWHDGKTWEEIRDNAAAMDAAVFQISGLSRNLAAGDHAELVVEQRVGSGYFRVLGVPPVFGREPSPVEDIPGGPAVCVVSHALAQRLFGDAGDAPGRTIRLKGEPYEVVGVAAPGFVSTTPADVWTPLRATATGEGEGWNYEILLRLVGDQSLQQAEASIAPLLDRVLREDLRTKSSRLRLIPLQDGLAESIQRPLLLLSAAVAAVLLIGCVNIAGLLTARMQTRTHELALRRALGGGPAALGRQLITESLALGLCGGLAGLAIAGLTIGALEGLLRDGFAMWRPLSLDQRALGTTAALALGCGLLVGLYPALMAGRLDLREGLERGGRGTTKGLVWPGRLLLAAQSAACVVILAGAGLMIRTLTTLQSLPPGFDPSRVVVAAVSLDDVRYDSAAEVSRLYEVGLRRLKETPGIEAAGAGQSLPYEQAVNLGSRVVGDDKSQAVNVVYVAGDYFQALSIPLQRGRLLRASDSGEAEPAAVVNQALVERRLSGRDPLEAHLQMGGLTRRIVGVVGDVQQRPRGDRSGGPLAAAPTVYVPVSQMRALDILHQWSTPSWVVRSKLPVNATMSVVQEAVKAADPLLPIARLASMERVQGDAWAQQRVQAILLAALSVLALTLAVVGVYGIVAGVARRRTREAAIRVALGASGFRSAWAVITPSVLWAVGGIAVGLLLAPGAGRLLEGLIWGVEPADPAALLGAAGVLLLAAVGASLPSAIRILRIQPARLLHEE